MNEQINIDSLMIRIPMDFVEVHEYDLIDTSWSDYLVSEKTGKMKEVTSRKKQSLHRAVKREKVGFTLEYKIKGLHDRHTRSGRQYLFMPISSKFLGERYFEGINATTAPQLYETLMSEGVVSFSYQDFLNQSECTQIEFVQNFRMSGFSDQLNKLSDKLVKSIKKNLHVKLTETQKEQSLRFTLRREETIAKPYIFIYNKELELLTNSKDFFTEHLESKDIEDLRRIEFRIKNRPHAERLGIQGTSLGALIGLSQDTKLGLLEQFLDAYLDNVQVEVPKSLTPQKLFMLDSLKALLNVGVEYSVAVDCLVVSQHPKTRSEKKKILHLLYKSYILKSKDVEQESGLLNRLRQTKRN